jgi:hypothetical protein
MRNLYASLMWIPSPLPTAISLGSVSKCRREVEGMQFSVQSIAVCDMEDFEVRVETRRISANIYHLAMKTWKVLGCATKKVGRSILLTIAAPKPFFKPPES